MYNPGVECNMNINISNDNESKETSMCVVTVLFIIFYYIFIQSFAVHEYTLDKQDCVYNININLFINY